MVGNKTAAELAADLIAKGGVRDVPGVRARLDKMVARIAELDAQRNRVLPTVIKNEQALEREAARRDIQRIVDEEAERGTAPLDQEEGRIRRQARGSWQDRPSAPTADEQFHEARRDRIEMRRAAEIPGWVMVIRHATDPSIVEQVAEEAFVSEHPLTVRALLPAAIARLTVIEKDASDATVAPTRLRLATRFEDWRKENAMTLTKLRDVSARRAAARDTVQRSVDTLLRAYEIK